MKKLLALAAFLLASSAAQAQYTFDYGGRTIRIDPDRGTVSIPGVYDNSGRRKRSRNDQDNDRPRKQTPQQAKVDPQAPAPAPAQTPAPANTSPDPSATANVAPADALTSSAAAQSASTPVGVWLTEEKEGKVRIEQCGANLCGYSVDARSNQNSEQVLINMKPGNDSKWSGRILDPNTGSTYESTIALKGPDILRVQGCALGGMFCGGQTWSRLN
jgi:uncharacterized protein (DUF2147 family)